MTNTNANSFRNKLFIVLILTLFLILLPAAVYAESDPEPSENSSSFSSDSTPDSSATETTSYASATPSTEPVGSQAPPEQPSADLSAGGDSTESSSSSESNTSLDSDSDTTSTEAPASESDDNHVDESTPMQSNEEQSENESAPAADEDCYVVELDVLDIANVNTEIDLQFTFAEVGESSIGAIDIDIPDGFSYVDNGITINDLYSTNWIGSYNSDNHTVNVSRNSGVSAIFKDDDPISILFRVITPATANDGHEFATAVKDADGNNNDMHESSSQPVVNVRDGSESSPFEIGNASQLDDSRNYLNGKHFIQTADIELGVDGWADGEGWVPIGNNSTRFTGDFDGNGKVISNLTINRSGTNYQGLFGYTSGATIEQVNLQNVNVQGNSYTGALAGGAVSSIIEDVHVTGTVTGAGNTGGLVGYLSGGNLYYTSSDSTVTGGNNTGGLVGYATNNAQIYRSKATGTVEGTSYSGGLVGRLYRGNVVDCYSLSSVEGTSSVGGLVGYAGAQYNDGNISGSYSAGLVTGTSNLGGLLGSRYSNRVTVTYSYWDTQTSGQTASVGGIGKTTAEMKEQATFESFNFLTTWSITEGVSNPEFKPLAPYTALGKAGSFSSGSGSEADPYIITTVAELNAVRDNLAAHYRLGNDIVIDPHQAVSWNYGLGFEPIGTSSSRFTGKLDGDGFAIDYLYVNRPVNSYQGLFGYAQDAAVEDLSLSNLYLRGSSYTGGLAGRATDSSFDKVAVAGEIYGTGSHTGGLLGYASGGEVTGSAINGKVQGLDNHTGGLVGYASGTKLHTINLSGYTVIGRGSDTGALAGMAVSSIIEDVHVSGTVSGANDNTGGLVGKQVSGHIHYCSSDSTVTGDDYSGGLVGFSDGSSAGRQIYSSYTIGSVTGSRVVGGLVGKLHRGHVDNCYSLASVEGTSNIGGLVGYAGSYGYPGHISGSYSAGLVTGTSNGGLLGNRWTGGSTVTDSYWDTETSKQETSVGEGTGKTTAEMKQMTTFVDWDISAQGDKATVWRIYETSTYPLLRHFFADTAIITVSADSSRDYDGTTVLTGGSYQLEDGKDADWIHEGTVSYQASSKNAGSVEIILMGVYSNQIEYDLVFIADDTVTINPRTLNLSNFTADSKVYDGTTAVNGTGFGDDCIDGDELEFTYTAAFGDKHVGTGKTVNYTGIAISGGADKDNYVLSNTNGTASANIIVLPITVTAVTDTRVYDGTTASAGVPLITSDTTLVGGDTAIWTQTFDTKDVGTGKTITPAGTVNDGNSGNNYAITIVDDTTGVINVKPITITPNSGQSKIVGQDDPVFTYTYTALAGGDQIAGNLGRDAGEDLGDYAYNLGTLSVNGNYSLLMTASPATFAITDQPADPDPEPEPDPDVLNPVVSFPGDPGFAFTPSPAPAAGGVLTGIPGQGANPIITPAFVTGGSTADLGRAIAAYNQAKQSYEANKGAMSAAERAVAEVEIAMANAAILALELRLAAQSGAAVNPAALIAAYQAAQAVLNNNRGLLSADQIAAAEALLNAIASVISSLST